MSKFFMYGSELQEIEQLIMLVPNFLPRRSGVIVVQRIRNEEGSTGFERDYKHITEYCKSNSVSRISNQIAGGNINYEEIVCSCFEKCESHHLNVRLTIHANGNKVLHQTLICITILYTTYIFL